jgi:hypothetical protein
VGLKEVMLRLGTVYQDGYGWRHFDSATAEVASVVSIGAAVAIPGTTEGALSVSQTFPGSGAQVTGIANQTTGPRVGGSVFWKQGLAIEVYLSGVATTGATPGTLILNWRLDTISGASLGASATLTLLANQTNITWEFKGQIICRSVGTAGTLWGQGKYLTDTSLIAAPAHIGMVPRITPATAAIDTTAAHQLIVTALLSQAGSSMTCQQELWRVRD